MKSKYFDPHKWHYRKNYFRKSNNHNQRENKGHPSLVVGEHGDKYINIGLTKSSKNGNRNNIRISNPVNFNETRYLRRDISEHDKKFMKEKLTYYKVDPKDINKILFLINKYKKKAIK